MTTAPRPPGEPVWHRRLALDPPALSDLRAHVRAAAAACGLGEAETARLVLAVDEAAQNIIRHGYQSDAGGPVEIALWQDGRDLKVRLRDFAPLADLAQIRPRPLDQVRPGGLGTHLIATIMDEVVYRHAEDGSGNILDMSMRWRGG